MKKQYLIGLFLLLGIGMIAGVYQYINFFQAEMVGAYSTTKPANGHSWQEMQCTDSMCIDTTNKRVGIGTDAPSVSLDVTGSIKASGDVCNGTGNCLSSLATLTNACGAAATNYAYTATAYSGAYCIMGTPTPATPTFPSVAGSATWTCPVTTGSPISCTATRAGAPVNGVCGAAAKAYAAEETAFAGAYCTAGTAMPANSSFPNPGNSTSWTCSGTNGGDSPSCTASRTDSLLVSSVHLSSSCVSAGGTVRKEGSVLMCRFDQSSCPSGWTQYQSWETTSGSGCSSGLGDNGCYSCCASCNPVHGFANAGNTCSYCTGGLSCVCENGGGANYSTCTATIVQIGCY